MINKFLKETSNRYVKIFWNREREEEVCPMFDNSAIKITEEGKLKQILFPVIEFVN